MGDNEPINSRDHEIVPSEFTKHENQKPEAGDMRIEEDSTIITLEESNENEKGDVETGDKLEEVMNILTEKQTQPITDAREKTYLVYRVVALNERMKYTAGRNKFIYQVCTLVIKYLIATIVFVMFIAGIKPGFCGVKCFLFGVLIVIVVSILSCNLKWARDRDWIIYTGVFGMSCFYAFLAAKCNAYVIVGVLLTNLSMPLICMGLIRYVDIPKSSFDFSSYIPSGIVFALSSVFAGVSIGLLTMFRVRNPHPLVVLLLGMITSALMTFQLAWTLAEESIIKVRRTGDNTFAAWMIYAYPVFGFVKLLKFSGNYIGDYV